MRPLEKIFVGTAGEPLHFILSLQVEKNWDALHLNVNVVGAGGKMVWAQVYLLYILQDQRVAEAKHV